MRSKNTSSYNSSFIDNLIPATALSFYLHSNSQLTFIHHFSGQEEAAPLSSSVHSHTTHKRATQEAALSSQQYPFFTMVWPTSPPEDRHLTPPSNASQQSSAPSAAQLPLGSILADPALLTSPTPPNMEVRPGPPSTSDTFTGRLRSASDRIFNSNIPVGMWDATGNLASSAPSLQDIRRGSYGSGGWCHDRQLKDKDRRASLGRKGSAPQSPLMDGGRPELIGHPSTHAHETLYEINSNTSPQHTRPSTSKDDKSHTAAEPEAKGTGIKAFNLDPALKQKTEPFDNGYQFPPKHTWSEATVIGLKAFWKFTWTPLGFFVVLYGLFVVAFGGMLFLLLCNAAPAMCKPDCNDINSPRRIWVEYDSQIVNALFCVTGFGKIARCPNVLRIQTYPPQV